MSDHLKEVKRAYVRATAELRKQYADEFHVLLAAEYEKAGLSVRKRLTGERKRQAEIARARALLAEAGD